MMPSSAALPGARGLPPPGSTGRASSPPQAVLAVPSHGLPYGLSKWCCVVAEGSREVGVVHNERFLELVEHLHHLVQGRVKETHCPQHDLRYRLDACRLADLLEDHLYDLARRDRL